MKRRVIFAALLLAGCHEQSRSVSFFTSHPELTTRVLQACANGTHRGAECVNARDAEATLERERRMKFFKRSFG